MLRKINGCILKVEMVVATSMAAVATCAILLQVIFRYFLRMPFSWPEELAVFLLTWITFIGASILLKRNEHIRVSLLLDKFPYPTRTLISIFLDLLMMLALLLIFYHGSSLFPIHNITRTVALHIPRGYFILPLIIASLSMSLFLVQKIWDQLVSLKKGIL
jgi:TRAP-type C4-dicarboxylate transport system permease small subunit